MFALVEDGKVTRLGALPKNWRNVSGLDKDHANAKKHGWLPATEVKPEFDPETHKLGSRVEEITSDEVTVIYDLIPLTQVEIDQNHDRLAKQEMLKLESVITDRRRDEALLGTTIYDGRSEVTNGTEWLFEQRKLIDIEREKLRG